MKGADQFMKYIDRLRKLLTKKFRYKRTSLGCEVAGIKKFKAEFFKGRKTQLNRDGFYIKILCKDILMDCIKDGILSEVDRTSSIGYDDPFDLYKPISFSFLELKAINLAAKWILKRISANNYGIYEHYVTFYF